jgi:hypothetical protein
MNVYIPTGDYWRTQLMFMGKWATVVDFTAPVYPHPVPPFLQDPKYLETFPLPINTLATRSDICRTVGMNTRNVVIPTLTFG